MHLTAYKEMMILLLQSTHHALSARGNHHPERPANPSTELWSIDPKSDMKKLKILILCTGNSARSIMGEYLLRQKDPVRFESFSAGSYPKETPHPMALRVLREHFGINPAGARSKSWTELKDIQFDFVITVCDNAREACPTWPGQPIIAHWGSIDPAACTGTPEEQFRVFRDVGIQIARRIDLLLNLPLEKLDSIRPQIIQATQAIGQTE
jgi:protein-tyrosine-phosphatase